ncbi:MAG: DUF3017 domain-containing protein [Propionibacteriaceae bacterium]|nr:DUF3017 domain-containing protein [Propionibacteriaceae bacterium]
MGARWMRFVRGWPRALYRQWPLLLVLFCFAMGVLLIIADHWRRGSMVIGGAMGLAGLMRLVLPEDIVGLLALRGRFWDAAVMGLAGLAIIVLSLVVAPA